MKVTVTEIQQSYYRFGFGFSTEFNSLIQNMNAQSRILPYDNDMVTSVTFEVESTKYLQARLEYSVLEYFSNLGGFGSLLLGISTILTVLESPQLFVASDIIAQKEQQVTQQNFAITLHSTESMQK